ncbi:MAG: hypothetical protein U0807_06580 [Candidatus Binatia bacterium]
MGISNSAARWLARLCTERRIGGRCLQLGRQDVFLTAEQLAAILIDTGLALRTPNGVALIDPQVAARLARLRGADRELAAKPEFRAQGYISDAMLFTALGFEVVESLDSSAYEGADLVFDLNRADLPAVACGRYDLVVDGGTMEHVFHVPNVFRNIHAALAVGGHVVHLAPSNNHVDHGFYQLSPALFWEYYTANRFELARCDFFRYTIVPAEQPWMFSEYRPGALDAISSGGLDDKLYGVAVCARKTAESTWDVVPQQGGYANQWRPSAPAAAGAAVGGA